MSRFATMTAMTAAMLAGSPAAAQSAPSRPAATTAQQVAVRDVTVTVDAGKPVGALPPVWRFFGADEPNYATMKDGRKLLVELGKLREGGLFPRAQPAQHRRRHARLQMGQHQRLYRGQERQPRL